MRRPIWLPLLFSACTQAGVPPLPPPPAVICDPASAGLSGAPNLEIPGVVLPAACRILEDDPNIAVFRRQVTVIASEDDLKQECRLDDATAIAGLIDFMIDHLLLVRIPDTSAPSWAVLQAGTVTIGERTSQCTGKMVKGLRYVVKVPATATVSFHLCAPNGCEEDP